jgi:hypothetical protein
VDDQGPGGGGLLSPLAGEVVQGLDQLRQGDVVVVQETVGAEDGSEAVSEARQSQSMNTSSQGIGHVEVFENELPVTQL